MTNRIETECFFLFAFNYSFDYAMIRRPPAQTWKYYKNFKTGSLSTPVPDVSDRNLYSILGTCSSRLS